MEKRTESRRINHKSRRREEQREREGTGGCGGVDMSTQQVV